MAREQQTTAEEATIVHELNLGEHTLIIMSDNSIDLMDLSGEPWSYLAHNGLHLTSDEAYHLYVSLHEVYKSPVQ